MFSSGALSQIIRYYGHAMQGMMGNYLEKNIQAFIDIQNKLAENSKGLYEGKPFSPEMWTQFMNVQGPMMQGMMGNYIEQSKSLFIQMQEQMQNQTKSMFGGAFPFVPPVDITKKYHNGDPSRMIKCSWFSARSRRSQLHRSRIELVLSRKKKMIMSR